MRDELFWAKVDRSGGVDSCWPYMGSRFHFGHALVRRSYKNVKGHRLAYEQEVGPIPDGQCVLHRCDNPPCCNPRHLFLGTQADNMADKIRKGRARYPGRKPKTHCVHGHELPPMRKRNRFGVRVCRQCQRAASRRHYNDNREAERARSLASYHAHKRKTA